ncbi:MAG: hypothetical protein IJ004_01560 [Clostridia bacterium]|nr:hypothetical protein [Clostridia bacterium]
MNTYYYDGSFDNPEKLAENYRKALLDSKDAIDPEFLSLLENPSNIKAEKIFYTAYALKYSVNVSIGWSSSVDCTVTTGYAIKEKTGAFYSTEYELERKTATEHLSYSRTESDKFEKKRIVVKCENGDYKLSSYNYSHLEDSYSFSKKRPAGFEDYCPDSDSYVTNKLLDLMITAPFCKTDAHILSRRVAKEQRDIGWNLNGYSFKKAYIPNGEFEKITRYAFYVYKLSVNFKGKNYSYYFDPSFLLDSSDFPKPEFPVSKEALKGIADSKKKVLACRSFTLKTLIPSTILFAVGFAFAMIRLLVIDEQIYDNTGEFPANHYLFIPIAVVCFGLTITSICWLSNALMDHKWDLEYLKNSTVEKALKFNSFQNRTVLKIFFLCLSVIVATASIIMFIFL